MRKLSAALALLFVVVSLALVTKVHHPSSSLGGWGTDHMSHYGTAILFAHRGFDIYRRPVKEICPPRRDAEGLAFAKRFGINPEGVCDIPERAGRRPLVINWPQYSRPYPPGVLLYSAPEALLYEHTELGFATINRLSILKYLFAACLLIGLLIYLFAIVGPRDGFSMLFILPLLASDILRTAFWGFYDGIAILCVCLFVYAVSKGAHHWALLFYAAAAFLHFRALWLLPVLGLSLVPLARYGWERLRKYSWFLLGSSVLGLLSAYAFGLCLPFLRQFPATNPIYRAQWSWENSSLQALALPVLLSVGLLLWERNWITGVAVLWQVALVVNTPQAQPWHPGFLIPIVVLARFQGRSVVSPVATMIVYLAETMLVFQRPPSLDWLVELWTKG